MGAGLTSEFTFWWWFRKDDTTHTNGQATWMSGWNKNHFHFHFLALIHPHLQILVSSFTRCGFLFAANSHFNAPAFLALDSIVVICVNFFLLSNSSASQVVTHMIRQFWQRKNLIGQRKKKTWTRMCHLRIAQTWPSWSSLWLNCCNTRSCYSRFGKSSNLEKSSACLILALLILTVWSV